MYCRNCGQEVQENAQFCAHCGASNGGKEKPRKKKRIWLRILLAIVLIPLILLGLLVVLVLMAEDTETEVSVDTAVEVVTNVTTDVSRPENGWYEADGKTYYLLDGDHYVGYWEIDGAHYYFDEDGVMLKNTIAEDDDGYKVTLDSQGKATQLCYPRVQGTWAAEPFRFGNGGRAGVLEFVDPIQACTSADFYLKAEGNYGSSVTGDWKIHVKIDGKWQEISRLSYSDTNQIAPLAFAEPVTIEAITAYPTKTGNASSSCYYELQNVWCNVQ